MKRIQIENQDYEDLKQIAEQMGVKKSIALSKIIGEAYNKTGMTNKKRSKRVLELRAMCSDLRHAQDNRADENYWKYQYYIELYTKEYNNSLFFNVRDI